MTVLEDDVIPVRNKLSLTKRYNCPKTTKSNNSQLKRKNIEDNCVPPKKLMVEKMLNGYRSNDHHRNTGDVGNECPVATLTNTGNTCYLNSVLYTLRFAPTFLHNLHHLVDDLYKLNTRLSQNKAKSSSLGRGKESTISGPSSRSTSSKDLLSLGSINDVIPKSKVQVVTEKLHELFATLHNLEESRKKDCNETTYQPIAFLQAVRDANSIFEGNQQQDAHELLVYLLDNIRETSDLLTQQVQNYPDLLSDGESSVSSSNGKLWGVRKSWKKNTKQKEKAVVAKDAITEEDSTDSYQTDADDTNLIEGINENGRKKCYNFVAEEFEGVTLRRTKCLECECVTERKEPFYDIPVPINITEEDLEDDPSDIYRRACVTTEKLCDSNKYLCEECMRYNEASREVSFEKLPNIMVLQLKRFTTTSAGVQKVNTYMPTPLRLACFCESCCRLVQMDNAPLHRYELCCVIMHLGGAMASGHYIAYVRASEQLEVDYIDCSRDLPKGSLIPNNEKTINNMLKKLTKLTKYSEHKNGLTSNNVHICKSRLCCGVKMNKNVIENAINFSRRNGQSPTTWQSPLHEQMREDMWLECDDDSVKPITSLALQDLLSYKNESTSTPYLLFYSKITENSSDD